MDLATARKLNQLTTDFYACVGASFSATRQAPWKGWRRVGELVRQFLPRDDLHVFDLACGNLRFERFLSHDVGLSSLHAWAVDNDAALAQAGVSNGDDSFCTTFQQIDVVGTLLQGTGLAQAIHVPLCDISVCFGFMHHLAMPRHRLEVLQTLIDRTKPGGLVVVSFWQFAKSPRIVAKARPLTDKGDYLLGWQGQTDVQRYCHSFTDEEVHDLVASLGGKAEVLARFFADGKTDDLNYYVVLRKSPEPR